MLLPFLTGQIPRFGNMLCPIHFPVLLCGLICGWPWGLAVGFLAPLLRYLLFGMPVPYPAGLSMAFELATYGLVTGLVFPKTRRDVTGTYLALVAAMILGRLVWGAARYLMAGLAGSEFSMAMFLSGALYTAWPGILLQFILLPPMVRALQNSRLMKVD